MNDGMNVEACMGQNLKYINDDLSFGYGGSSYHVWDWYSDWYRPIYTYPTYIQAKPDKTKQAFKVAKYLLKKGIVRPNKVKDFVELVDGILENL